MAASKIPKSLESGLTLIEVLIALAIVGIALTAVIKATSQNIRATQYLQDKTIGTCVAQQVINEEKLGVVRLPSAPDHLKEVTNVFGRDWYWEAGVERTQNPHINKILVLVFKTEDHEDDDPIVSLESYILREE